MSRAAGGVGRVAVVGLGLVGGSLTRLLAARGADVVATDTDPGTRSDARAVGLAVADDLGALCAAAPDLVVLAVPLRAVRATAAELAPLLTGADTTLTDVGSVKGPVRAAVRAAGLGDRYVGAHPMAGTEHSGFGASDAGLLDGAPWAVTVAEPGTAAAAEPARLAQVLRLVTGPLGGTAAVVTDDRHDEAAALVSHVPHVLATQLLNAVAGAPVRDLALGLAAGSFRDGTRVALTDPARTEAMVTENAAWVAPALRKAVRDLEVVIGALETNGSLHDVFHAADDVREERTGRARTGGPVERLSLAEGWTPRVVDELVSRGSAGSVVVGVDADAVHLRPPR
ncbi:prephenate dehydrogenase/arogenate dehydrogenase family protein [Isoptericola sp. 4D.3]|uniref:Prephenate dehydrogenase/arogenate dehydrogenase family protein n=1 Tax=Isoptericola peretonis TaxID=2918523 RepID=A0ABT0IYC6_9MICO|nr:prephenate dehydrogenase/arogenate dehydrogenase family protein [Isoptericola sp. 4D.3]